MARLGALYASQTGDTSQCTLVEADANAETTGTSTFCACVFETCGNGVWRQQHHRGSRESWMHVKVCQKYCHAGVCV
jgi:hypothetical protein